MQSKMKTNKKAVKTIINEVHKVVNDITEADQKEEEKLPNNKDSLLKFPEVKSPAKVRNSPQKSKMLNSKSKITFHPQNIISPRPKIRKTK